jgi:hypothetical protein
LTFPGTKVANPDLTVLGINIIRHDRIIKRRNVGGTDRPPKIAIIYENNVRHYL